MTWRCRFWNKHSDCISYSKIHKWHLSYQKQHIVSYLDTITHGDSFEHNVDAILLHLSTVVQKCYTHFLCWRFSTIDELIWRQYLIAQVLCSTTEAYNMLVMEVLQSVARLVYRFYVFALYIPIVCWQDPTKANCSCMIIWFIAIYSNSY